MDRIQFSINEKHHTAGGEFSATTSLNDFIRKHANLPGTKYMCRVGGCGVCIVNIRLIDPNNHEVTSFSVNSCLVPVLSCDGWEITTIEGIGNRNDGYNIIQKRLNHFFGSQCGYCSLGFIMTMHSLIQSNKHLTEEEIENSFGGNLCRCTGYRPILEAFKSLIAKPNAILLHKIKDLEDIDQILCPKSNKECFGTCSDNTDWCTIMINNKVLPKKIFLADGKVWYLAYNVKSIFKILDEMGTDSYMLVAGSSARGARPLIFYPKLLIDINNVNELRGYHLDTNLVLGANNTLTDTMSIFHELSKTNEDFWYLNIFYNHLEEVANIPVRNIGTLAGNLVLKHEHPDFQSDIFLLFDCVGATITLVEKDGKQREMDLNTFRNTSVVGKVMTQIKLPPLSRHNKIVTFKNSPRRQNAHAEVNAAFLYKFDYKTNYIEEASLVYGGIDPKFTHAYKTEKFLVGRNIFKNDVLQQALKSLDGEIQPNFNPPAPLPDFRKKLALGLFYKGIIRLCPQDILNPIYASGATTSNEDRPPVSRSYQEYDTDKKDYPITQQLLKREGMIQCSGEASYCDDIPKIQDEVFASFVLSSVSNAEILTIDGSDALKADGVVVVLTSRDIPGKNSFIRGDFLTLFEDEELLASSKIRYYNQPVAIVVAESQALADQAVFLVKVKYKKNSTKTPIFTIEDAIEAPQRENRLVSYPGIVPMARGANVKKVIKGKFINPRQYHHMMELHTSLTKPVDDLLEVYCSTQYMDLTQAAIARLLNISESSIVVVTRRCGGAFGCKISRHNPIACATALVAKKLDKPCRMSMRLTDIMRALGKRPNYRVDYEIDVDQNGQIQYMDATLYANDGLTSNENENGYSTSAMINCYDSSRWKVDSFASITDGPTNCFMRAPGGMQGISAIEHIMDHIAAEIQRDPIAVRMANYRVEDNPLPTLVPMFLDMINFKQRREHVEEFNAHNRWKKRGLKITNMAFPTAYLGNYSALVAVYHGDGSVIVHIGGIEMGQGIFTKMIQVAAREFKIPVEKVTVLPCTNFTTPNNFATASSITSECCAYAVIRSCDQINARIAPVRAAMPTANWEEVVFAADEQGINLQANYLTGDDDLRLQNYSIFGITAVEVEIDILTGTKWIVRADVFQDVGRSINPAIDVGQVEGAFVQGVSAWMLEDTIYNDHTGEIYTDSTWNYYIIGAKDIPHDFRVYFRRKAPNPVGVLGSKAVGEPAICMGHVVVEAIRMAIQASRHDSYYDTKRFLDIRVPVTNESVVDGADVGIHEYLLY